jgi:hypothetical protein
MCELARNSVIQSGWEMKIKQHWIGKNWYLPGPAGNDIQKTNVPNIRLAFRHETLREELQMIDHYANPAERMHEPNVVPVPAPPPGFSSSAMIGASSLVEPTKLQQDMVHNREIESKDTVTPLNNNQETLEPGSNGEVSELWQSLGTSPSHDCTFPGASVLAQRARERRLSQDPSSKQD